MEKAIITSHTKLADLVELNYSLLDVLTRVGIGLGFGEQTVADACRTHSINISSFLLVCNAYTFENYVPAADLLATADLNVITLYLHNSHISYLEQMTKLETMTDELIEALDVTQKHIVKKFYKDYHAEVVNHFNYEEAVVFPYVKALLKGEKQEGYSIEVFEENHSDIDEKLNDLKNIVMKYLPASCDAALRNKVLYRIFRLEEDLFHHTLIEDNIMVLLVNQLEDHGE